MKKAFLLGIMMASVPGVMSSQNNFYVGFGGSMDFLKTDNKMGVVGQDKKSNTTKGKFDVFAGWVCNTCSKLGFGFELRGGRI